MPVEFVGCAVLEARMRSDFIVMPPPDFDEDTGFDPVAKPLHVQAFVAELAIEALVVAVLPRLTGVDQGGIDLSFSEPRQDSIANEFRTVVRTQEHRCPVHADQTGEHVNDAGGADTACDIDGEALAREFVDHGEAFDLLSVGAGVVNEIVGPHLIRTHRRQWTRP